MLNVVAVLLSLILVALVFIARDLRTVARARALDFKRKGMRESIIGFGPTVIAPGKTASFVAEPAVDFEGERLIVASSIANSFAVDDIAVGGESQAVSSNPIPAAAFSELAVGVNLGLRTANKKAPLTLKVSNASDKDATFSAALVGLVQKDAELGDSVRAKPVDSPVSASASAPTAPPAPTAPSSPA